MKKIEQPVLMLIDSDAKLVNVVSQIFDLRPSRHMSRVFQILQSASDLRPMTFDLSSNVLQRRLSSGEGSIEFESECYRFSKYTAYMLLLQGCPNLLLSLR